MKRAPLIAFVLLSMGVSVYAQTAPAPPPSLDLAISARKAAVTANVEWSRVAESSFDSNAEVRHIFSAVDGSRLYSHYEIADASKADIIIKIDEDRMLDSICIVVLNPDDNSEIYRERRDLIAVDNDVKRLIAHFLKAVKDARDARASAGTDAIPADPLSDLGVPASTPTSPTIDSTSGSDEHYLWVGRYEEQDKAQEIVRKIHGFGLPVTAIQRNGDSGPPWIVVTGPYSAKRLTDVSDSLKAQGYLNIHEFKWTESKNSAQTQPK